MSAHSAKYSHSHGLNGKKPNRSLSHDHLRTHSKESKDHPNLSGAGDVKEPPSLNQPIDIAARRHHALYTDAHPNFQEGKGLHREGLRLSKERQRSHDIPCSPKSKESFMHLAERSYSPKGKESYMHHASANGPHSPKSPKAKDVSHSTHFSYGSHSPRPKESKTHHAEEHTFPRSKHSAAELSPPLKFKNSFAGQEIAPFSAHHHEPRSVEKVQITRSKDALLHQEKFPENTNVGVEDVGHHHVVSETSGSPPVTRAKEYNGHVQLREAYSHRRRTGAMSHPNPHHKLCNGTKSKDHISEPPSPELPPKSGRRRHASSEDKGQTENRSPSLPTRFHGIKQAVENRVKHGSASPEITKKSPLKKTLSDDSHDSSGWRSPELPLRSHRKKHKESKASSHKSPELPIRWPGKKKKSEDASKKHSAVVKNKSNDMEPCHGATKISKHTSPREATQNVPMRSHQQNSDVNVDRETHNQVMKPERQMIAKNRKQEEPKSMYHSLVVIKVENVKEDDPKEPKSVQKSEGTDHKESSETGKETQTQIGHDRHEELLEMIDNDQRSKHEGSQDKFLGAGMVGGHLGVYRSASMPGYTNKSTQLVSRATCMSSGSSITRSSMTRRTVRQKHTKSWSDASQSSAENWKVCPVHKVCKPAFSNSYTTKKTSSNTGEWKLSIIKIKKTN